MEAQYTKAEIEKFLSERWENAISFCIENNPREVHDLIQQNFYGQFGKMAIGVEKSSGAKDRMQEFLEEKAMEYSHGAEVFSAWVYAAIPKNPDANNWTTNYKD